MAAAAVTAATIMAVAAAVKQRKKGTASAVPFVYSAFKSLFLLFISSGCVSLITQSAVTVTLAMLPSDGTVNIVFIRIDSRIERSPLAPVF